MYQVRIYIQAKKPPVRSRGVYGYRLETIGKNGKLYEKEVYDIEERITAYQLVLVAMCRALEELNTPCEIEVFTDSLHLRGNYENHLKTWMQNDWINARGEPVANKELWKQLVELARPHVIRFNSDYQYPARAGMVQKIMDIRRREHV